mgnify:CR=1 FL=1
MTNIVLKYTIKEEQILREFLLENRISRKTLTRIKFDSDGSIKVNGREENVRYLLKKNDIVEITLPSENFSEFVRFIDKPIDIVYEDSDIAVINKQAGLVVHPAHGHYSGTLVNALLYHIKDLSGINGEIRPGIVHRLDKDTSGLIVIAKNDKVHTALTEMFQEKKIRKTYLAILKGKLNKIEGRVVTQIGRDKNDRKKMTVIDDAAKGKNAITNYRVISQNNLFTLVKVNIETGRTHQIRVHMRYLGYPILGDSVYGRKDNEKKLIICFCTVLQCRPLLCAGRSGPFGNLHQRGR